MPVPVLVQNEEAGPAVFTDHITKDFVEWAGKGDPMGGDIQVVPEAFFNNANFIRACQRGTFSIVNGNEVPKLAAQLKRHSTHEAIIRQREAAQARRDGEIQTSTDAIERPENRDLLGEPCVGPSARGTGTCETPVAISAAKKFEEPPLCAKHRELIHEYVPTENTDGTERKVTWSRVTLGPRERQ